MNYKLLLYDFADNLIGEISNVFEIATSKKVNKVGYLKFILSISNAMLNKIVSGSKIEFYDGDEGYFNTYAFATKQINVKNNSPVVMITCLELSSEFAFIPIDNKKSVTGTVKEILECLSENVSNWTINCEAGGPEFTVDFIFTNFQQVLNQLCLWSGFNWKSKGRSLSVGNFGNDSGIVATNTIDASYPLSIPQNRVIIRGISKVENFDLIYNCIVAYSTNGPNDTLTLNGASPTNYPIKEKAGTITCGNTVPDLGTAIYYLENPGSSVLYGQRFKFVNGNIKSIDNSANEIQKAKNKLLTIAETELRLHSEPQVIYEFDLISINTDKLEIGDLFFVDYVYSSDNKNYIVINNYFYVLGSDITRDEKGKTISLDVSNKSFFPNTDYDYIYQLSMQVNNLIEDNI